MKISMINDVMDARTFAEIAHGSQMYGKEPYMYHLNQVAKNVIEYGNTYAFSEYHDKCLVAAYLHDVLEDTQVTKEELELRLGQFYRSFQAIVALTNVNVSDVKMYNKFVTYTNIKNSSSIAQLVKLCDRLANVSNGEKLSMYQKEYPMFRNILYTVGQFPVLWQALDDAHGFNPDWVS